ncbi:MAG: hypothetical protein LKM39_06645 [Chiayiivirga sp.]|jgi:DNA mismatch repair ATPase MutS|nr:hypothetical protein [Chiayiivirga sp.]
MAQPPALLRDGGVIADGFDADLDELRRLSTHADQFLIDLEAREREASGIATLKVGYNRVHGYYIEISKGQADKAPTHYTRRQTLTGAERYITEELKAFEDKVLSARERALTRERTCCTSPCWTRSIHSSSHSSAAPPRCRNSTCCARLPNARWRWTGHGPCRWRRARPADRTRPPSCG